MKKIFKSIVPVSYLGLKILAFSLLVICGNANAAEPNPRSTQLTDILVNLEGLKQAAVFKEMGQPERAGIVFRALGFDSHRTIKSIHRQLYSQMKELLETSFSDSEADCAEIGRIATEAKRIAACQSEAW